MGLAVLCALILCGSLGGCSAAAFTHANYESLRPATIAIAPVVNGTVYPLERVSFGGPLQRFTFGASELDMPHMLGAGIEEEVRVKGYNVVVLRSRPEFEPGKGLSTTSSDSESGDEQPAAASGDVKKVAYDAIILTTINEYTSSSGSIARLRMAFDVKLYDAASGEQLYASDAVARYEDSPRQRSPHRIPGIIQSAASRAMGPLPDARGP